MTTPGETPSERHQDEQGETEKAGAEIGMTEGEGSTFEPEEDPEGS